MADTLVKYLNWQQADQLGLVPVVLRSINTKRVLKVNQIFSLQFSSVSTAYFMW